MTASWLLASAVVLALSMTAAGVQRPLIPPEWWASFSQRKWNQNGDLINHTLTGTWYSSVRAQKLLVMGATYGTQNASAGIPVEPMVQISVSNFQTNVATQFHKAGIDEPSTCETYPGAGGLPPPPADFLSMVQAIWDGVETHPLLGQLTRWTFFLPGDSHTVITFYFNAAGEMRRWTLAGADLLTGVDTVYTELYIPADGVIPASIFNDTCPQDSLRVDLPKAKKPLSFLHVF